MKNTKIFAISILSVCAVTPSMAAPTHTSATFPQSGVMEEDYQYTGQANVTNLKVASGTANTLAGYTDCPSGYPNSDAGATSTDECYKACTVADLPANSHAATASGKNYSGANVTDTCAIATCETGYTFNPGNPDLTTLIGVTEAGTADASIRNDGTTSGTPSDFGITVNNTWGVDYGTGKGKITGKAVISTQGGTSLWGGGASSSSDITTSDNVTADFTNGTMCWCQIDTYTSPSGISQSISAPWVLGGSGGAFGGGKNNCAPACGGALSGSFAESLKFRVAVFNAAAPSAPSCDANVITINWDHADEADITANDAGSVTYGGNINTPKKAQHINGKIFTGWTFVTPNQ